MAAFAKPWPDMLKGTILQVEEHFSKLVSFYVGTGHRQFLHFLAQDLGDYM